MDSTLPRASEEEDPGSSSNRPQSTDPLAEKGASEVATVEAPGEPAAALDATLQNMSEEARHSLRRSIRSKRVTVNDQRPDEMVLSFDNVGYAVDVVQGIFIRKKVDVKYLVKNITGTIIPGSLTAIMGPSGAGKTTLLDLLAGRVVGGHFEGVILYNNRPRDKNLKSVLAYVEQQEILLSKLTVRETLVYTARMKLPAKSVALDVIEKRVGDVMEDLGLMECADTMVGGALTRGISGGQMKRLNIAIEMSVDPVVLFLDEPTSGLDSKMALDVMSIVRRLTNQGLTVVCTIHQPSIDVYDLLDKLLLLVKGEVVYNGDPQNAAAYFMNKGFRSNYVRLNPAEFIISVASFETDRQDKMIDGPRVQPGFFAAEYRNSAMYADRASSVRQLADEFSVSPSAHVLRDRPMFANNMWMNTWYLTQRAYTMYMRDRQFWMSRCVNKVIFATILMSVFVNTGYTSTNDLLARQSVIFLSVLFFIMGAPAYIPNGMLVLPSTCAIRSNASF